MAIEIERVEELKSEWTDKYVVVAPNTPELRRFEGRTGRVKTVNMNCRALVEFDSSEDISWYDIDPSYLSVVDAPVKKKAAPAAKAAPAKKAAGKPAAGKSPLELAREQAAGKKSDSGEKKLSPLELARQQGAGGGSKSAAGKSPLELAREQAAGKKSDSSGDKKLSPLELARQQGAAGSAKEAPAAEETVEEAETAEAVEQPAEKPQAPPAADGKKLSPLELARQQGAFKG